MATLNWIVPKPEHVFWADTLNEVPEHDQKGKLFWKNINLVAAKNLQLEPIKEIPQNFPRLIRKLDSGVGYPFYGVPKQSYDIIANILPPIYRSIFSLKTADENWTKTEVDPQFLRVKIEEVATTTGMLVHPLYGDSLHAWISSALLFQRTKTLLHLLLLPQSEFEEKNFSDVFRRFASLEQTVTLSINGIEYPLTKVFVPGRWSSQFEQASHLLRERRRLKYEVEKFLVNELQSINEDGNSEAYPYFNNDNFEAAIEAELNQLERQEKAGINVGRLSVDTLKMATEVNLVIKCGLYHAALYQLLQDIKPDNIKLCPGCGSVFIAKNPKSLYCPTSRKTCEKRHRDQMKRANEA